jgi:hypothetical protein
MAAENAASRLRLRSNLRWRLTAELIVCTSEALGVASQSH